MVHGKRQRGDRTAFPVDGQRRAGFEAMHVNDRRIFRIARAPAGAGPRHAAGRAAAEDREGQTHAAAAAARGTLANRRKKFSVVCRQSSSNVTPRTSASTLATSTT